VRGPLPIGAIAALAVALVSLAGCGPGAVPSPFTLSYPAATAGADPLPISLVDQTGLVSAMRPAAGVATSPGVEAVPGDANALRVSWQGGPCDDRVTLVLNDIGGTYELAIHNHPPITAGIVCDESTVFRVVDITFNRPLDPAELTLNIQYP
jgi:hypothetical protein